MREVKFNLFYFIGGWSDSQVYTLSLASSKLWLTKKAKVDKPKISF